MDLRTPASLSGASIKPRPIPRLRWFIAALLLLASALNYIDRQSLSLLAPTIQKQLSLDNSSYALILNLFLAAYTASYILSGRIIDRIGVRLGLALFLGWWSVANLCTGFVRSAFMLGTVQVALGLGEAGNWTAGPKAVSEWFPAPERGIALGICTLGATVGATLAPVIILGLAGTYGWSSAFFVTGTAGLLWLVPWLWLYRRPEEHPRITPQEASLVLASRVAAPPVAAPKSSWLTLAQRPEVWRLLLARLLTDPVWFFFQFWFAKYLHEQRGVSQQGLAITWVIFLAADIGTIGGGWFSGLLVRRGRAVARSRIWIMAIAACLVPLTAVVPWVGAVPLALTLAMIAVFAHLAWLVNLSALVVDLIPSQDIATTFGMIAAGSTVGGMGMNWAVASILKTGSYTPVFALLSVLHPIALVIVWRLRKR